MAETQAVMDGSARLREAAEAFGPEVRVSEPFAGRPPLWIEPVAPALRQDLSAAAAWMAAHGAAIEAALLEFGGIVWRGFPVAGPGDFERLFDWLEPFSKGYAGGTSDRKAIAGKVMEATRTPPTVNILMHQEMSYLPFSPRLLAFYCAQPSETGGETVIGDMRGFLGALPADLRGKLVDKGVHYIRNLRSEAVDDWRGDPKWRHFSWQYWFDSQDPDEVGRQLAERGASFRWNDDGGLTFWTEMPATTVHPVTGEELFFNQVYAMQQHRLSVGEERAAALEGAYGHHTPRPYMCAFGNGDPLEDAQFMTIHEELERRKVAFAWQPGDVMLLENRLTCHGRHRFTGERDVQVMLFE